MSTERQKPLFLNLSDIDTLINIAERFIDDDPPNTDQIRDYIIYGMNQGETILARMILDWANIEYTVKKYEQEETTED